MPDLTDSPLSDLRTHEAVERLSPLVVSLFRSPHFTALNVIEALAVESVVAIKQMDRQKAAEEAFLQTFYFAMETLTLVPDGTFASEDNSVLN